MVNQNDQSGHDHELYDNADAVRNAFAQQRDNEVGKCRHHRHGSTHHQSGLQLGGRGKAGANAQHQHGDGIGLSQGFYDEFF